MVRDIIVRLVCMFKLKNPFREGMTRRREAKKRLKEKLEKLREEIKVRKIADRIERG